jgi:hypothetical protein
MTKLLGFQRGTVHCSIDFWVKWQCRVTPLEWGILEMSIIEDGGVEGRSFEKFHSEGITQYTTPLESVCCCDFFPMILKEKK